MKAPVNSRRWHLVAGLGLFFLGIGPAFGGPARVWSASQLHLKTDARGLHLELLLNPSELAFAREVDRNGDGRIDPAEWRGRGREIGRRILNDLILCVNGQPVEPGLIGMSQSFDSPRLAVRAHYAPLPPGAILSVESRFSALAGGRRTIEVSYGQPAAEKVARLAGTLDRLTFEPTTRPGTLSPPGAASRPASAAFRANDLAAIALLGLVCLACIPPAVFGTLVMRLLRQRHPVHTATSSPAT